MYIPIALTNLEAQVTSGLLTLEDITNTKCLVVNCGQRNTEANYGTYQSS